ncbi:MAG: hypothetical protein KAS13_04970 [Candidatus Omnitrophica bacterium]|nr:hypothetical protein [Candidatus Omnitrophota bacterium]
MKIRILTLVLFLFIFSLNVLAAGLNKIVLEDGTVIYGNIINMENGQYKIKTQDMGIVSVAEEKVLTIRKKSEVKNIANREVSDLKFSGSEPTDPNTVKAGIEALKRGIGNDPGTMKSIGNLQNDPDFMTVLNDPAIMSAVESGDINALTSNPKFMKLLSHPTVRGVERKVR